jgi:hypothetical protein
MPKLRLRGQAALYRWAQEYLDNTTEEKRERERSDLIPELPRHLDTPDRGLLLGAGVGQA